MSTNETSSRARAGPGGEPSLTHFLQASADLRETQKNRVLGFGELQPEWRRTSQRQRDKLEVPDRHRHHSGARDAAGKPVTEGFLEKGRPSPRRVLEVGKKMEWEETAQPRLPITRQGFEKLRTRKTKML